MKYQNGIERIADAVGEISEKYICESETSMGELDIQEYGGTTPCIFVKVMLKDFKSEQDFACYAVEVIRIFNAYMPEMAEDPVVVEKSDNGDAIFLGRPLLPQQVAIRQNSIPINNPLFINYENNIDLTKGCEPKE